MAVRDVADPGIRRVALGRLGFVALACGLYVLAGVATTWPAVRDAGTTFLAEGRPGHGEAAPGDHLQSAYRLWLAGHQLERGGAPWLDPYSFQPEAEPWTNVAAWPFGVPFWPLHRLLGTVQAWNAFVLLASAAGGLLTFLWLGSLGLGRAAALAGGLAYALAPYLAAQSAAGHLLAATSMLLPLALWALEKRWSPLAVLALASIPLSGQLHLALGAIPFFAAYSVCRRRLWAGGAAAGAAIAAGLLVYAVAVRGSLAAGDRSFAQVERYSADALDFLARDVRHGVETFVFLGWLTPLGALVGLCVLIARRRAGLALVLGIGVAVPAVAALGANVALYEPLWRHLPGLHETRVPGRLMPIACLCVAALVAFAIDRARRRALVPVALVLLAVDLRLGVELYRPTAADERSAAYAVLRGQPRGALLDLPVFLPDRQEGSVYLYYAMQAPRPRPLAYSTVAPPEADSLARRLRPLNCGGWDRATALVDDLGVRYVALHAGLYTQVPRSVQCRAESQRELVRHGFRPMSRNGAITLYARPALRGRSSTHAE